MKPVPQEYIELGRQLLASIDGMDREQAATVIGASIAMTIEAQKAPAPKATSDVYSRPECIFNYCPHPEQCKPIKPGQKCPNSQ